MSGMKTEVREKLAQYLGALKNGGEKLKSFDRMIAALEALAQKSDALYQMRDNEYTPMTKADFDEITALYRGAYDSCSDYLTLSGNAELPEDSPAKAVRELLGRDIALLSSLSIDETDNRLSLPEAVEKARGYTVDLTGRKLNVRGGAQSSRIPLHVVSDSGQAMDGFFTRETTFDAPRQYTRAIETFYADLRKAGYPRIAAQLGEQFGINKDGKLTNMDALREYVRHKALDTDENGGLHIPLERLGITGLYAGSMRDALLRDRKLIAAAQDYVDAIHSADVQFSFLGGGLGLKRGANVDRRNVGMSIVANMLGKPELVANAVPMTILNGNEVSRGVFMENAKGLEISSIPYDHPAFGKDIYNYTAPEGLRSMAGLQILDYICQNADRHAGNIFFRFNEAGEVTGVQGIDNDASFGVTNVPANRKLAVLAALDDLMVIPADVARSLTAMTKEMLQNNLRGTLTGAEIEAAWYRVEKVRARIELGRDLAKNDTSESLCVERGKIRVVEDGEWARLSTAQLVTGSASRHEAALLDQKNNTKDRKGNSEFRNIFDVAGMMPYRLRNRVKEKLYREKNRADVDDLDDAEMNLNEAAAERDSRRIAGADKAIFTPVRAVSGLAALNVSGDKATAEDFYRRLKATEGITSGHKEYIALRDALHSFRQAEALTRTNTEEYRRSLQVLSDRAQAYIDYKKNPQKPKELERVFIAGEIKRFVAKKQESIDKAAADERAVAAERHEREVAGTLGTVRGMAAMIDHVESRIRYHEENGVPALARLGKSAMDALNGLIDYTTQTAPTDMQKAQMEDDLAAMVTFQFFSSAYDAPNTDRAALSEKLERADALVQGLAASDSFRASCKAMTPERIGKLISNPAELRLFTKNIIRAKEIEDKNAGYTNRRVREIVDAQNGGPRKG